MNNVGYLLKDKPLAAWSMDSSYFPEIYDSTGNENAGTYNYDALGNIPQFPLIGGSNNSVIIDSSKGIVLPALPIADKYSSWNSFSIEMWIYVSKQTSEEIVILSSNLLTDSGNNSLSISYKNNSIYFSVEDKVVIAPVPDINRVLHIVAIYDTQSIYLYINGKLISKSIISGFIFTKENDESTRFLIGPSEPGDIFLVDDVTVYRYALSDEQIFNHYMFPVTNSSEQISFLKQGSVFTGTDSAVYKAYEYSYPKDKKWLDFYSSDIYHNSSDNSISLADGLDEAFLFDSFYVLSAIEAVSSKVEWEDSNGIEVYVSHTGEDDSYVICRNGYALPEWRIGSSSSPESSTVFVKIRIYSQDGSTIKPKLKNLKFYFYTEKDFYASNDGSFISIEEPSAGLGFTDIWDVSASSIEYPPFQRNKKAGYRPDGISGFAINMQKDMRSLEMIWHTGNSIDTNTLIYCESSGAKYSWSSDGIESSGVDSIYINGVDVLSASSISSILNENDIYHVVINLSSSATGKIFINSSIDSEGISYNGGMGNSYSHITLYEDVMTVNNISEHYGLYRQIVSSTADSVSVPVSEIGIYAYNNDWKVIKSV